MIEADKPKILFVHQTWKGFEEADYDILRRHFCVSEALLYNNFYYKTFFLIGEMRKADIVFCWFAYLRAIPLLLIAKIMGKKIIIVGSGWEAANMPEIDFGAMREGANLFVSKLIVKAALNLADKILAISVFNQQELLSNAGVAQEKIKLIYLGVKPRQVSGSSGFKKNNNLVLTVGQINRQNMLRKGLDTFIAAARVLKSVQFVLVGGTPELLEKYIEAPLPANLKVVPFSHQQAQEYYRTAKVYVQVSGHENFALSLAEAMSYECVPVVTDKAALPEVVGQSGYYATYRNIESTVQAIQLALQDDYKGYEARQRVEKLFPLEQREKELVSLLETVMAK